MRRVHVIVRGDVQGVGYRYTMRMVARDAGTSGWVRNRRDGSVEAEIEGTDDQVDEVLAWMAEGPPGSRVDDAAVTERDPSGEATFEVLPDA
ncbi:MULTISPECIES: acylphosphatase [unclassified Microbacterium]|uniref:acylphosphatase n=1 Tax=unclassified Microbacterium TaxID=2609290 RepID=UPI00214AAB93|nr:MULTISPECIES: acylphosphatase [unclassified Microbacterium]MCR2783812.1 acylphosphatase [Microbacterium sp. zg.B96]MDL5351396.1 acylphosphatase [Microbacterium sp. zg-YB36]WIM15338.1 acylphosphatase [Microbacterium sp. zg-B96]